MTNFSKTQFIKSAINKDGFLFDDKQQVCFVGRSNVGKSSLINMLCNRLPVHLARRVALD